MRRRLLGAIAATAMVCLVGCTGQDPDPLPADEPGPTTLASYDAEGLRVVRSPFCDRVSPTGIEHALGDVPESSTSWRNGDRVRLPDGSRDRVHEYGCSWTAADGTKAGAWVFVPPVGERAARNLAGAPPSAGCRELTGQPFGSPSAAWTCALDSGGAQVRIAGLFGDAWLTCELTGRDVDVGLVGSWCVAVLEAARA